MTMYIILPTSIRGFDYFSENLGSKATAAIWLGLNEGAGSTRHGR